MLFFFLYFTLQCLHFLAWIQKNKFPTTVIIVRSQVMTEIKKSLSYFMKRCVEKVSFSSIFYLFKSFFSFFFSLKESALLQKEIKSCGLMYIFWAARTYLGFLYTEVLDLKILDLFFPPLIAFFGLVSCDNLTRHGRQIR